MSEISGCESKQNEKNGQIHFAGYANIATEEIIRTVKEKFLDDVKANPNLYDSKDIEKIEKNDYFVKRFINYQNQGSEKGLEHMKKAYKWRKDFNINNFDQLCLPKEVYQMGAIFIYLPDKENDPVLHIRGKMHRKVDLLMDRIKHYFAHLVNELDEKVGREFGWSIIVDATDSGYQNADVDMLTFIIETLRTVFPNGIKYFIIYGLPTILNAFAKLMLSLIHSNAKKHIRFFNKQQLLEFVDEQNLPDFLGGTCTEVYRRVPKDAIDVYTLSKSEGLTREQVEKLLKPSSKYIDTTNFVYVEKI
ncbi:Motile sperm domain-containing protein 2-like protein [Dinothrombium tinctorium]|uniref:Motile sperm domain-containing protein 2-like protein n=1 Tax=Dinothrombium tinctorium TaxID=1965070 RepID=A0A443RK37_9ACAR|nr:Motile sperm domain-containing protein 2-like protein [Dinothrombium tinctorium]RWS15647.1 Motile sperm domain-containing protein 2-like protein [Dinothrombium tinctorium]